MFVCIYCNKDKWKNGKLPFCIKCITHFKAQKPFSMGYLHFQLLLRRTISSLTFKKLLKLPTEDMKEICKLASSRFYICMEYGVIYEWSNEIIFADYLEAIEMRDKRDIPIEIPINDKYAPVLSYEQYISPINWNDKA